jgi:RNA polymerase sigma factor (sigma-70 family)
MPIFFDCGWNNFHPPAHYIDKSCENSLSAKVNSLNWLKKKLNQKQFAEWISCYHGTLYKHAFWMTGNQDLAMDMVQEAFFQAWLSMESLQDSSKALPWLLTILRRTIYREQRYSYRHAETVAQLNQMDTRVTQTDAYPLLEIYSTLESLSPNQREVFLLHHLHGFSYEEISSQLEIPLGTVMSRLSRARDTLQKQQQVDEGKVIQLSKVKQGLGNDGR